MKSEQRKSPIGIQKDTIEIRRYKREREINNIKEVYRLIHKRIYGTFTDRFSATYGRFITVDIFIHILKILFKSVE